MSNHPTAIQYFGTDLSSYGHHFWELQGSSITKSKTYFDSLPFNPEQVLSPNTPKGLVRYAQVGIYAICAISGSCYDKRGGTKSVFWVKGEVESSTWKDHILAIPIAKRMIEQMPFDVQW